jgi:hypothetical protein
LAGTPLRAADAAIRKRPRNRLRGGAHPILTDAVSTTSLAFGGAGFVLWLGSVSRADFFDMGSLGLVTILRWPYFVGLAFLAVGIAAELLRTPLRTGRMVALVIGLVVMLFGTASAVEPVARLADGYVHSGFIQYIYTHGAVLNNYDARFSWPGGFSLGALLVGFTGQRNALGFLRWAPLAFELLYLAPMMAIAKASDIGKRAGWLGIIIFYATNWIDQDYFSPQALNYLFFLVMIATVLTGWQPARRAISRTRWPELGNRIRAVRAAISRRRLGGGDAVANWNGTMTLLVAALLAVIAFASAISHQLTPYAMILALGACLVTARLGRPELIFIALLFTVGWLSLGASNYWIGHLSSIFGSVGQVGSTVGSNVTSRVTGNPSHREVVEVRILLEVAVVLLAGVGVLRRATSSRTLEFLAGVPVLLVVAQNYGGEALLRVALFSGPFIAFLAAAAILPSRTAPNRPLLPVMRLHRHGRKFLRVAVAITVLGLSLATAFVRGGNDAYEAFSSGELSAVSYAYAHVHGNQSIGIVTSYLPIGAEKVGTTPIFVATALSATPSVKYDEAQFLQARPAYIILSQSQEAWGEILGGYSKDWQARLENDLVHHGYHIAKHWNTATVLHT